MQERIEERLEELRSELSEGDQVLRDLQKRSDSVRRQMLRISGAIQVLEELQAEYKGDAGSVPVAVGQ